MLSAYLAKDNYIVDIGGVEVVEVLFERLINIRLKGARYVIESERHDYILIRAVTSSKGYLPFVASLNP